MNSGQSRAGAPADAVVNVANDIAARCHAIPGHLPPGVIDRLSEHYGPHVLPWFDHVKTALAMAAERWKVRLIGYHDAGWTAVVAFGTIRSEHRVLIKASPDIDRYEQERAALAHWRDAPVNRLLAIDDTEQLLLLDAVAGVPGGAARPADHQRRVAAVLEQLHEAPVKVAGPVPTLIDYYLGSVLPRVERRAVRLGPVVGADRVARCVEVSLELCRQPRRQRMLHADLYAENVLFDGSGAPVFVDPHPKIGSPAFDWAFWCVYYLPTGGFEERAALCREHAPNEYREAMLWALTLAVDGALYYSADGGDVSTMLAVLDSEPLAPLLRSA